jgi:hypothetical protein
MARFYKRKTSNPKTILFHHGLIHILVENQLGKAGDKWATFVTRNGFLMKPSLLDINHFPKEPRVTKESNPPQDISEGIKLKFIQIRIRRIKLTQKTYCIIALNNKRYITLK